MHIKAEKSRIASGWGGPVWAVGQNPMFGPEMISFASLSKSIQVHVGNGNTVPSSLQPNTVISENTVCLVLMAKNIAYLPLPPSHYVNAQDLIILVQRKYPEIFKNDLKVDMNL